MAVRVLAEGNKRKQLRCAVIISASAKRQCGFCRWWKNPCRNQSAHIRCFRKRAACRVEDPNPVGGMSPGAVGHQFFGKRVGSVLAQICAYREHLIGQNGIVFGERVADYDRIKNAKSASEQQRCRHRKEQNKLERDGARVIALAHLLLFESSTRTSASYCFLRT